MRTVSGILRPQIFEFSALKSHVLFPARAEALLCSQTRTVVSGSEIEKLWKKCVCVG